MFDAGFSELALIFVIGLLILGPERLPRVAAQIGRWVARARRTANQLRMQLEREVALDDIRRKQDRKPSKQSRPGNAATGSSQDAGKPPGDAAAPYPEGTAAESSEGTAAESSEGAAAKSSGDAGAAALSGEPASVAHTPAAAERPPRDTATATASNGGPSSPAASAQPPAPETSAEKTASAGSSKR